MAQIVASNGLREKGLQDNKRIYYDGEMGWICIMDMDMYVCMYVDREALVCWLGAIYKENKRLPTAHPWDCGYGWILQSLGTSWLQTLVAYMKWTEN